MSDYLLDTDVLIHCLRGLPQTIAMARELLEEGELHISVWSQLEILTLTHPDQEKRTLDFLTPFILHPVTEPIAHRAAELVRADDTGQPGVSPADAIVAATALQHGLTLVSTSTTLRRVDALKLYPISAGG